MKAHIFMFLPHIYKKFYHSPKFLSIPVFTGDMGFYTSVKALALS
jgi:hypothetical protein